MKRHHNITHDRKEHLTEETGRTGEMERRMTEPKFLSSLYDMERMFHEALHTPFFGMRMPRMLKGFDRLQEFTPSVDIIESKGEVTVKAELPGMTREDISVKLEGSCLILSGEKKASERTEHEGTIAMERTYGMFHRMLPLPEGIDSTGVTATFKDGVLEVHIPRKEEEKNGRTIPVK